jgi:hypothetical protein
LKGWLPLAGLHEGAPDACHSKSNADPMPLEIEHEIDAAEHDQSPPPTEVIEEKLDQGNEHSTGEATPSQPYGWSRFSVEASRFGGRANEFQ